LRHPESEFPEGKRPLGKPKRRRENNIKTDVKEIVCEDVDWIHLAEDIQSSMVTICTVFYNVQ
jgi:hypothetical protein